MTDAEKKEIMNHFIEQLEAFGIELGNKLDQIEQEKQNYHFLDTIKKKIMESRIDFCSYYVSLEEEEKQEFQNRLLNLFKDQEIVDNIIQEIINLYYLNESGLLDLDETKPQKEIALENLNTLLMKIEKYIEETNIDQLLVDEESLAKQLDRLVSLGSIMEQEESSPVQDIDFLEQVLERSELTGEEKKTILLELITYNVSEYNRLLSEKETKKESKKQERKPQERKTQERKPQERKILTIKEEYLREIEELLSDKEVIERIVRVINDDFTTMIRIKGATKEEQEQIQSAVDIARDEIKQTLLSTKKMTPQEALNDFFRKYDDTARHKKEMLNKLIENVEESKLPEEEQKEIYREAFQYADKNQGLIASLSQEAREKLQHYAVSLYQDYENRKVMYETKAYDSIDAVEQEASYEIQIIRELLEVVSEEDKTTRSKLATRLEEILRCVKEITKPKEEVQEASNGTLFYLIKDDGTSTLEEDLALETDNRGIPPQQYGEINNQLKAIKDRSERTLPAAQPVNPSFKAIKKLGIRYTNNVSRTKVFFIPVGKKDAIVVGAGFLTGKDVMKDQDLRAKKYSSKIEELKERLSREETYEEEKQKSSIISQRIFSVIDNNELEEMLRNPNMPVEEVQYQK